MLALLLRLALLLALAAWVVGRLRGGGAGGPGPGLASWWQRLSRGAAGAPAGGAAAADPYAILEVDPGASELEIRAAYQQQMQRYHPDQVAHLGAELREVAERRSKAINAAYAQLRGDRRRR